MGKIVQVNNGYSGVLLISGQPGFNAGQSVTVTDAEYTAYPSSTLRALTVTNPSVTDPVRTGPLNTLDDIRAAIRALQAKVGP